MSQHTISSVAHLIAEPVRAVMLITLSDGGALPAGALADAAGVTPQTASSHLAKLLTGGLVTVETKGRHRYYRLAGPHVALALESLASVGPVTPAWRSPPTRAAKELRFARCCYDHLAGQIGVAVTRGMLARGFLVEAGERDYGVTPSGIDWLRSLGLDVDELQLDEPGLVRQCLDWTERQRHVAGPFGARLLNAFFAWDWMRRVPGRRSVLITPLGWAALKQHFGIEREGRPAQPNIGEPMASSRL
ncbi:helix-turn-helix transcriptional regulator [Trinickia terrae]|uniref:Helix-turn-helix transcriptional regulator n=1 Tax=Trinickia terrae TaxID=2571161 RepID=A0A4U1ID84_9BURK|nr:helix-turn-helix transcriptional regulator [Trinickia terrae]TKC91613.1 helix-turn-helix transcriptional regulator [Trinickia terrae]